MFDLSSLSGLLMDLSGNLLAAAVAAPGDADGKTGAIIALIALTAMEIVLGIDNIVFISIVTGKLPAHQQKKARLIGLGLAMGMRIVLLMLISYVMGWTKPIVVLSEWLTPLAGWLGRREEINAISVRDLILFFGGLFLIFKSVKEIDHHIDSHGEDEKKNVVALSFGTAIFQILLLDLVFSLDSVITAVGMANEKWVMITAVIIAVLVMMLFAGPIARFVEKNPTVKMLALSFLLMIGVMLIAEGFGTHINKGYIYFAMAFALLVEILNLRSRSKSTAATVASIAAPKGSDTPAASPAHG